MPFDGSNRSEKTRRKPPKVDPTGEQSFLILEEMQRHYGKDGEKWAQGVMETPDGRCCLMGAVVRARRTPLPNLIAGDRVTEYLAKAIWGDAWKTHHRFQEISHWNELAVDFWQIARVLEKAKGMAAADMENAAILAAIEQAQAAEKFEPKKARRRHNYMAHAVV